MTIQHKHGLIHDLPHILGRRSFVLGLGGATIASAVAANTGVVCIATSRETAGPFPSDGTNKAAGEVSNILKSEGVIRTDIRNSIAGFTPVATGIELNIEILLIDVNNGCAPLANHAMYLWHCDAKGQYSIYDTPESNYLRGVGVSDSNGVFKFTTIVPGCYDGRWPHIHFEIFENVGAAINGDNALLTSQFAIDVDTCAKAYAAHPDYAESLPNLERVSLERDGIFRDNSPEQIAQQTLAVFGDAETNFTASVTVGIEK